MDIGLILFLILLNGLFAMSEIAIISARKVRLQQRINDRRPGAAKALALHNEPSRFLSTVQVGITTVGITIGAIGESALAEPVAAIFAKIPWVADYAEQIGLGLTVVIFTYLSVVIGELVPKRLALLAPEMIASIVAGPLTWLARLAAPVVWLFSSSSSALLRLLGAQRSLAPPITNEEIKALMQQGAEAGVFHESEQDIVSAVLRLDEQRVGAIMTPRTQFYSVDLADEADEIRQQILESPHSRIIVCREGLENIVGVVHRSDLLISLLQTGMLDVAAAMRNPLYVPESVTTTKLLESLRKARMQFAMIIDEYGEVQGIVTLNDVLAAIVGEVPMETADSDTEVVTRDDGSYLVGGGISIERLKSVLELPTTLPGESDNEFHTLGGFIMHQLGRVPTVAEYFIYDGWRFEVVDMDKTRIDKVLIAPAGGESA